jgi:soluble cytochrome b562
MGIVTIASAVFLLSVISTSAPAAGDKDMRPAVIKIGDAFKAGKVDDAKKDAAKTARAFDETSDLMHLFRNRDKGGLGLENRIQMFLKKPNAKDAPVIEDAAYHLAAMAELIKNRKPVKGKNAQDWANWADDMRDASLDLAKAANGKNVAAMTKAAGKVQATCNACHAKYKMN